MNMAVGYADVDITPPLGITMPGYFHERRADGVLDPLRAKVLAITKNETTLVIAALDLIGVEADVVERIRDAVHDETGVPPQHVFVHATHTHTGATVSEIEERLPGQVASAVRQALDNRVSEAEVTFGKDREQSVAFIRRFLMKDGTVRTNPGRNNPEIVRPVGEIDSDVNVVTFGAAKTMLVSYGLHPDCVGGTKFSADYPHHLTVAIQEKLGADWNVVYLNATCGNVNHINVQDPNQRSDYEGSREIGRKLAEAALAAHESAKPITIDRLAARTETVPSPARGIPAEVYQWAKLRMQTDPEEAAKRRFNERSASRIVELAEMERAPAPAEIMVIGLGPVAITGLPAEVFVEVARDIKVHSQFNATMVIGLTGGSMGYVPHPRGYQEGGYEATYSSARYSPDTPELWRDAALRMLLALRGEEPSGQPG